MEETSMSQTNGTFSGSESKEQPEIENGFTRDLNSEDLDSSDMTDEKDQEKITVCSVIPFETNEMSENDTSMFSETMKSYTCEIDGKEYTILIDLDPYSMFMNDEKIEPKISIADETDVEKLSFHRSASDIDPDDEIKFNLYSSNECNGECPCTRRRRRHPFIHRWELAYGCDICGKQFKTCSILSSHMKKHNKKLRKCKFCDKLFGCKASLRMHLPVHNSNEVVNSDDYEVENSDATDDQMNIYDAYNHVLNIAKETESKSNESEEDRPEEQSKNKEKQSKSPKGHVESEHDTLDDEDSDKTSENSKPLWTVKKAKSKRSRKKDRKKRRQQKADKFVRRSNSRKTRSMTFNGATRSSKRLSIKLALMNKEVEPSSEEVKPEMETDAGSNAEEESSNEMAVATDVEEEASNEIAAGSGAEETTSLETAVTEVEKKRSLEKALAEKKRSLENAIVDLAEKLASKNIITKALRRSRPKGIKKSSKGQARQRYTCEICFNTYARKNSLKRHYLVHNVEKAYQCGLCGKCFSMRSYLTAHLKIHTGGKPFTCEICSKGFNRESNMKKHMYTHSATREYKCRFCEKEFNHSSNLKRHEIKHTGLKLHVCMLCGKGFTLASGLKEHMLVHEVDPEMHRCDLCNKAFKVYARIKRHMKIHVADPKHVCILCSKGFHQRGSWKRHMMRLHPEVDIDNEQIPQNNTIPIADWFKRPSKEGKVDRSLDKVDDNDSSGNELFDSYEEVSINKLVDSVLTNVKSFGNKQSGDSPIYPMTNSEIVKAEVSDNDPPEQHLSDTDMDDKKDISVFTNVNAFEQKTSGDSPTDAVTNGQSVKTKVSNIGASEQSIADKGIDDNVMTNVKAFGAEISELDTSNQSLKDEGTDDNKLADSVEYVNNHFSNHEDVNDVNGDHTDESNIVRIDDVYNGEAKLIKREFSEHLNKSNKNEVSDSSLTKVDNLNHELSQEPLYSGESQHFIR